MADSQEPVVPSNPFDNVDVVKDDTPMSPKTPTASNRKWGSSARTRKGSSRFSKPPNSPNSPHSPSSPKSPILVAPTSPMVTTPRSPSASLRESLWTCNQCNYQNADPTSRLCALCGWNRYDANKTPPLRSLYLPGFDQEERQQEKQAAGSDTNGTTILIAGSLPQESNNIQDPPTDEENSVKTNDDSVKTIPTSNKEVSAVPMTIPANISAGVAVRPKNILSISGTNEETDDEEDIDPLGRSFSPPPTSGQGPPETAPGSPRRFKRITTTTTTHRPPPVTDGTPDNGSPPTTSSSSSQMSDSSMGEDGWDAENPVEAPIPVSSRERKHPLEKKQSYRVLPLLCTKRVLLVSSVFLLIMAIIFIIIAAMSAPESDSKNASTGDSTFTDPPFFSGGPPPTPPGPSPVTPTTTTPTVSTPPTPSPTEKTPSPTTPPLPEAVELALLSTLDSGGLGSSFGTALATSRDGKILAIGAPDGSGPNGQREGVVQVYGYVEDEWKQLGQDLVGRGSNDDFGIAIALSDDGSTLAIGSPSDDLPRANVGIVKVYRYDAEDNIWFPLGQEEDMVGGNDGVRLGSTVSLALLGEDIIVAVGSLRHVLIFKYDPDENTWIPLGIGIENEFAGDGFWTTSLSQHGLGLAIGAPDSGVGFAQVYDYDVDNDDWTPRGQELGAFFVQEGDNLKDSSAPSVSLADDGNVVAVRTRPKDNENSAILVFSYDASEDIWKVLGSEEVDSLTFEYTETSDHPPTVALSGDGRWFAANGFSVPLLYGFDETDNTWRMMLDDDTEEIASDQISLSGDGSSVAVSNLEDGEVAVFEL